MNKKKTATRKKINWEKLKQEYLTGEIESVTEFLLAQSKHKIRPTNGDVRQRVAGWSAERKALQKEATEKVKREMIEKYKIPQAQLLESKYKILKIVNKGLAGVEELIEFDQAGTPIINKNASGLKTLWEIVKTELGEVTKIDKTKLTGGDEGDRPVQVEAALEKMRGLLREEE